MQALNNFTCRTNCRHQQCQRHANLGFVNRNTTECECIQQELTGSSMFLENVIDLSHTLAQIMIVCGIQECKAKTAVDIITHTFLHYDLVCYCLDAKPSKRLRKEDIFFELGRKCQMNRVEANLCYNIIKRGFKAFYYQPPMSPEEGCNECNAKPSFSDECVYVHAAKKTAESYARFDGLSREEHCAVETKIKVAYKKFYDRMQSRKSKLGHHSCNCCFCCKHNGGHLLYTTPQAGSSPPEQNKKHSSPTCCQKVKSHSCMHPPTVTATCPECQDSLTYCLCKCQFNINWIGNIRDRSDLNLCDKENIERAEDQPVTSCSPLGSNHNEAEKNTENNEEQQVLSCSPQGSNHSEVLEKITEKGEEKDEEKEEGVIEGEHFDIEDNAEQHHQDENEIIQLD